MTYDPDLYGRADYVDNDCDGLIDEELCIGEYVNEGKRRAKNARRRQFVCSNLKAWLL